MPLERAGKKGAAVTDTGWYEVSEESKLDSVVVGISGQEKSGKTSFAFTAPTPIAYFNLNFGDAGVIEKYVRARRQPGKGAPILRYDVKMPAYQKSLKQDQAVRLYEPIWEKAKEAFMSIMDSGKVRTIILDTADELYDLIRLARFGKLTQVAKESYHVVYAELEEVLKRPLYVNGLNAIYISKSEKEYKPEVDPMTGKIIKGSRSEWTGGYTRKGYKSLGFITQINLESFRTPAGGFAIRVDNSRFNPSVDGMVIAADEKNQNGSLVQNYCTFPMVAMQTAPDIDPKNWE